MLAGWLSTVWNGMGVERGGGDQLVRSRSRRDIYKIGVSEVWIEDGGMGWGSAHKTGGDFFGVALCLALSCVALPCVALRCLCLAIPRFPAVSGSNPICFALLPNELFFFFIFITFWPHIIPTHIHI